MNRAQQGQGVAAIRTASNDGPIVTAVAPQQNQRIESSGCHGARHAAQALRVIEGENKAAQYVARLIGQQATPDELAISVSMLYGAILRGFCREIERALRERHG